MIWLNFNQLNEEKTSPKIEREFRCWILWSWMEDKRLKARKEAKKWDSIICLTTFKGWTFFNTFIDFAPRALFYYF